MIRNQFNRPNSIQPTCDCCFPPQTLVTMGQRAYCPITERIHQTHIDAAPNAINVEPTIDFYPGRTKQRGEAVAFKINPAEERFGAQ